MEIILGCSRKDIEVSFASIADFQHASHVATAITVIRSTPDGAKSVIVEYLVAFLAELVSTKNVGHIVDIEELLDNLSPKSVTCSAWGQRELVPIGVWV